MENKTIKTKRKRNQICGIEALFKDLTINSIKYVGNNHLFSPEKKLILEPAIKDELKVYSRSVCLKSTNANSTKINELYPCLKECKIVITKHIFAPKLVVRIPKSFLINEDAILFPILNIADVNQAVSVINTENKSLKRTRLNKSDSTKGRKGKWKKSRKTTGIKNKTLKDHNNNVFVKNDKCSEKVNIEQSDLTKKSEHIKFTRLNKPGQSPTKFNLIPCDMANCQGQGLCKPQNNQCIEGDDKEYGCNGFEFCHLGCLCNSLENSGRYRFKNHCNNYACGFGCLCGYRENSKGVVLQDGSYMASFPLDEKRNRKLPLAFRDNSFILHPHIKISRGAKKFEKNGHDLILATESNDPSSPGEEETSSTGLPCSVLLHNLYDPVVSLILSR